MKKVEHSVELTADPEEIFAALVDERFVERMQRQLDRVADIEIVEVKEQDDGRMRRVLRYTAPTDLPRFLRRFKDRAPDEVNWDEVAIINPSTREMTFEIIPEVPEHWHELYESRGQLTATDVGGGKCRVEQVMEYSVDSPSMGFLINKAISREVSNIFKTRATVLEKYFQ